MSRQIDEKEMTQKVALYMRKYGVVGADQVMNWIEESPDHIRVSEIVEITFTPLPDEDVLSLRLAALDREIEKVRAESTQKIADLTDQKKRLMAITHQEAE